MICLTDLKGHKKKFKASSIREIRAVPDTVLIFMNGNCQVVAESIDEVIDKYVRNPRSIGFPATEVIL